MLLVSFSEFLHNHNPSSMKVASLPEEGKKKTYSEYVLKVLGARHGYDVKNNDNKSYSLHRKHEW